jgi:DnaK suppressor protein
MTKIELKAFRRALENRQTELGNGSRNREALAFETSPDELDRIQHATERELAMGHLERESHRLREVRDALCRVDTGEFGICLDCGQDIKLKRLVAVPWATFCIICQEVADRDSQQPWNENDKQLVNAA